MTRGPMGTHRVHPRPSIDKIRAAAGMFQPIALDDGWSIRSDGERVRIIDEAAGRQRESINKVGATGESNAAIGLGRKGEEANDICSGGRAPRRRSSGRGRRRRHS